MVSVLVQVAGREAEREARDLRGALIDAAGTSDGVSQVEVDRSPELVIAVIALALQGVGVAKTMWDWWQEKRSQGVEVRVVLEDGRTLDLSTTDEKQLVIELGSGA